MKRSAYNDWAEELRHVDTLRAAANLGRLHVPAFVVSDLEPNEFFRRIQDCPKLFCDPMERELAGVFKNAGFRPRVEAVLYRAAGYLPPEDLCTILHEGLPVAIASEVAPRLRLASKMRGADAGIAVIDDGIGFLNARFRATPDTTRFLAVWLQAMGPVVQQANGGSDTLIGRELSEEEINGLVTRSRHISEATLYSELNGALHGDPGVVRTILQAGTHGTHVLDLAAGADPTNRDDPMLQVPLIGVQLPAEAVDDTSGQRMVMPLIQGLRWAILVALQNELRRLVVNVSLGVLAGPKDGRSFLERQMEREIARAAHAGLDVEIVLPYGNDYDSRQVARLPASLSGAPEILLRLQPDDATPTFVELRDLGARHSGDAEHVEIGLVAPDGTPFAPETVPAGAARNICWRGQLVARLYHVPARQLPASDMFGGAQTSNDMAAPFHLLAFAPTLALAPGGRSAPSGRWTIIFGNAAGLDIVLQIQRDDRAAGYRLSGRQAYFDAPDAYGWTTRTRDWTGLEAGGALRHEGTNSAYATSIHPAIHSVGAALLRPHAAPVPAPYASRGAAWSGGHPRRSAVSEIGHSQPGLTASGTLSATTARFSGSSVAAPSVTRALVAAPPRRPATDVPIPGDEDRLGASVVTRNAAIRR